MPRIEAVFVGTELLEGRVNTHCSELAALLGHEGWSLARECSVGDSVPEIAAAIGEALGRAEAVLVFGGLGPTFDDLSREGAALALDAKLRYKEGLFDEIRGKFKAKRMPMAPENRRQAYVLEGARVLGNRHGSAPGQLLTTDGGRLLALLPGPAHEMRPMLTEAVLPALRRRFGKGRLHRARLRLAGILEGEADKALRPFLSAKLRCTILSAEGLVDFYAASEQRAPLEAFMKKARRALGQHLYAEDGRSLAEAVERELAARRQDFALAESCTGGLASKLATDVPGSSKTFAGGVVAYSNRLKSALLGVPSAVLSKHGAVSDACARAMAEGARKRLGADWALSLTGIAGPGGGLPGKPVGRVHAGLAGPKGAKTKRWDLSGDRAEVRAKAVNSSLYWLWTELRRSKR